MKRTIVNVSAALLLSGLVLHAVPAWAVHFVSLEELDVGCGSGMHLRQATGVPGGAVHTYAFGGACSLRTVDTDGHFATLAAPPLVASAHWDLASKTYTESLHLLSATTITHVWTGEPDAHLTTYPEVATFKCDVDPVIHPGAHCTLDSQYNDTGWHSKYRGDQVDGFAWKPNHNRPLLLGLASKSRAAALSKNKHPQISCAGLKLVSVHDLPHGIRRYHFDGTCELYHTADGSGGLRLTHVFVTGFWNANGQDARETFNVAVPGNEGGGLYRMAYYTCAANPFIHGNVQCSLEKPLHKLAPVYDPITDLRAKHPISAGRANPTQVAQLLSKSQQGASKQAKTHSIVGFGHHGNVAASRKNHPSHLAKSRLTITTAIAGLNPTMACRPDRMIDVTLDVRNAGGPLSANTRSAYVHVEESGGASLKSLDRELPAIAAGQTWHGDVMVGTSKAYFSKLPGEHMLLISIGPSQGDKSHLAFVPPPIYRVTLDIPAGYCQPKLRMRSPAGMRMQPGTTKSMTPMHRMQHTNSGAKGIIMESPKKPNAPTHRMSLPAVQLK